MLHRSGSGGVIIGGSSMMDCSIDDICSSAKRRNATKGLSSPGHCRELREELLVSLLLLLGGVWLRFALSSPAMAGMGLCGFNRREKDLFSVVGSLYV